MRRPLSLLALAFAALPAFAAPVTVTYQGVVSGASGPHEAAFAVGQPITVSYTVDPAATDTDDNPAYGVFRHGVQSMRIVVPAAGVDATTAAGDVQTFNDVNASDQAFFYADATGGSLAGHAITRAEVDFLDFNAGANGSPVMLSSDALPTQALVTDDSFALLYTDAGYTFVRFVAEAAPTPAEAVASARADIARLVDSGALRTGNGSALDSKLSDVLAAYAAGNQQIACDTLDAFRNQVRALEQSRQISAATASELRRQADIVAKAIGC